MNVECYLRRRQSAEIHEFQKYPSQFVHVHKGLKYSIP